MLDRFAGTVTVLALAAVSSGAFTQSVSRPPDTTPPDKYGPPIEGGNPPPPQEQPAPGDDSGSLGDHLSGSGGVVKSPPTGDTRVIPPPSAGPNAMPVI
ncbi:MAG: hypothetical protein ACREED_04165, partial [Stellaceae bacterium]